MRVCVQGSSVEEAQLLLDDHTIKSQAMQSSPAAVAFIDRITLWVKKLSSMQDILDAWLTAQVRTWCDDYMHLTHTHT